MLTSNKNTLLAIIICLLTYSAIGQEMINRQIDVSKNGDQTPPDNALPLHKLEHNINFDGKIGDTEWDDIPILPLVSHWPLFNEKPNKQSLVRIAYDEKYIYLSALCYDGPSSIQSPTFERDVWNLTNDQVALILDTYNDNENGVVFVATPNASRVDVALFNDAQGDSPVDLSWNSYWETRTSLLVNGWSAEIRIPLTSLRFQPQEDEAEMGIIVYRYSAQKKQLDIYPSIPPDWGFWSFLKVSKAQDVIMSANRSNRPWFVTPYALAALGYHHETHQGTTAAEKQKDNKLTAGLDVQHALSENINLDLTLNTDFAQVEADDQVVNLSRFSLFFPEKRKFFLERSSVMEFGFENNNKLFYSRKIGINEGNLVPMWGGARIVGRLKDYDVGILSMQSRKSGDLASENFSVMRLRKKVSKSNSYLGGIMTARTKVDGKTQLVYGMDGIFNLFKNDYLKINLANSSDLDSKGFLNDTKRLYAQWENRSQVGFNYALNYSQVDKNYNPSIGFEERFNYKSVGNKLAYGWFAPDSSSVRLINLTLNNSLYFSNENGRLESHLFSPSLSLEWKKSNLILLSFSRFYDRVTSSFELSEDITIPTKTYVNYDLTATYNTNRVSFLNCEFKGIAGLFYEGKRYSASITPSFTISKYITLGGYYAYNFVSFEQGTNYNAHVARFKISTSLNVKLSMNAFAQLNSLAKLTVANFRLRYNSRDGNDLFLVYNAFINHQASKNQYIPLDESQGIILKFVHTFFMH